MSIKITSLANVIFQEGDSNQEDVVVFHASEKYHY